MTNNLTVLKKDLKSFAKRVKDFKYTESALITFLLTGLIELTGVSFNLFSAENEIQEQTKAINTSITNLKSDFRFARHENDKLLRKTNLELVKLMEQGDHVVKSPWSSWQYGINGFYNSWQGSYKGRGDKTADYKYERDKTMSKTKYEAYPHTLYGNTTELGLKQEPNASIPVSATLNPLIPKVKHANVSMAVDISELPSFTPRTVTPPTAPVVSTAVTFTPPTFSLVGESLGNGNDQNFDNGSSSDGYGVIEGVSLLKGNFVTELTRLSTSGPIAVDSWLGLSSPDGKYYGNQYRSKGYWSYAYNNYRLLNTLGGTVNGNNPSFPTTITGVTESADMYRTTTNTGVRTGFLKMTGGGATTMVNNANIMYTRKNTALTSYTPGYDGIIKEVVHLDIHDAKLINNEDAKVTNVTNKLSVMGYTAESKKVTDAWDDFKGITDAKGIHYSQTFINSGTTVIEGEKVAFSNSYDHSDNIHLNLADGTLNTNKEAAATVINTGSITIHPMHDGNKQLDSEAAVFVVSPEISINSASHRINGIPQILYNSGNIDVYNKKSAVFFINPDGYERFKNTEARRDITIVNREKNKIKMYGDQGVGVYIKTPNFVRQLNLDFSNKSSTVNGTDTWTPMTLYGDHSIGLYIEDVDSRENDTSSNSKASTGNAPSITKASSGGNSVVYGNFAVDIGDASATGNSSYSTANKLEISNVNASSTVSINNGSTEGDSNVNFNLNNLGTSNAIEKSFGIFSNYNIDFSDTSVSGTTGINKFGHQINIFGNTKENIGVLTGNDAIYKLGKGSINLSGTNSTDNIGVLVGGNSATNGKVIGDVVTITGASDNSDRGNRAIVAVEKNSAGTPNSVEVNEVKSTGATNSIAIVADDHSTVKVNSSATNSSSTTPGVNISGSRYEATASRPNDNVGAAYANKGATITIDRTVMPTAANISITGGMNGNKHMGFGLFANNEGNISAKYNSINVTNASTAIAALNGGKVDLDHSQVEYSGEGYALYAGTDATPPVAGEIKLTNGKLVLGGNAVGYVKDQGLATPSVVLTGTNIDVKSDDVIIADLRNSSGTGVVTVNVENKATPNRLRDQLIGGVGSVGSSNGKTRYKYAVVDNAQINIKSAVDKADNSGTDTDSEVFAKRFLYQNSKIDVTTAGSVKAELDDTQMKAIDVNLKTPVGLAVTASAQTKDNDTTGINNSGTVSADRTVGSDRGGIGLYVDYGYINNNAAGTVNVEKGTVNNPNDKAIGIFGTNSTKIVNDGKVNAGGKKSIGILGLSYRIDSKTGLAIDPKTETYYNNVTTHSGHHPFGVVDVENGATGKITMDNDGAVGMFVKNNSTDNTTNA